MKNFQSNLLIFFALALCGLCVFQWQDQTVQRNEIDAQNQMLFQKASDIQGFTNSVATLNAQVIQMDVRIAELKNTAATNSQLIASQKTEINHWQLVGEQLTNQITQYQEGLATLQGKLKEAYAGISQQNAAISNLVAQRDDYVRQYNASVKDRNEIVGKYNDLAKQVEKLQSGGDNSSSK
ncbi:MAG TPA: hypothetical protein VGO57_08985 [Verrucomicrobiae bacterium]|jgi:chromosome segregation ATPase